MSAIQNAKEEGAVFELMMYDSLIQYFPDFVIRKEKDITKNYGKDITAIDIEIYKQLKTKDLKMEKETHVFIQTKWKNKSEPVKSINHFTQCCNNIMKDLKLDEENIHSIYATKIAITEPGKEALSRLKNSENIVCDDMNNCIILVIKQVAEIFGKKLPKITSKTIKKEDTKPIVCFNKEQLEEMKKIDLVTLVMDRFGYKKTVASKIKHAELVQIIINDNKSEIKEEIKPIKKNINIMKVEYDDYKQRNIGECKSKLLKPGSDLYNHITKLKAILRHNGFVHQDRMGLHSEVLNDGKETLETFLERVKMLEGREIDVKNPDNYDVVGRAVVLMLGDLDGYNKDAKITIAFFNDDKTLEAYKCIIHHISIE
jgi:hypothetical protein